MLFQHPFDERPDLLANPGLQRIEPVRTQEWTRVLDCDSLRHGVISSGGVNRRSWVEASGDYATFKFPLPLRHDQPWR